MFIFDDKGICIWLWCMVMPMIDHGVCYIPRSLLYIQKTFMLLLTIMTKHSTTQLNTTAISILVLIVVHHSLCLVLLASSLHIQAVTSYLISPCRVTFIGVLLSPHSKSTYIYFYLLVSISTAMPVHSNFVQHTKPNKSIIWPWCINRNSWHQRRWARSIMWRAWFVWFSSASHWLLCLFAFVPYIFWMVSAEALNCKSLLALVTVQRCGWCCFLWLSWFFLLTLVVFCIHS